MRPWVAAVVRLLLGVVLALNAALRSARGLVRSARGLGETVRGRPPPPPRVLGVVVAGQRKSLGEDELRATARVINWAVATLAVEGPGCRFPEFVVPHCKEGLIFLPV